MKVVLIGDITGSRDGRDWPPRGSIVDLPDDEAATLCRQRMARPVAEGELVERAVLADPAVEVRAVADAPSTGVPGRRARAQK